MFPLLSLFFLLQLATLTKAAINCSSLTNEGPNDVIELPCSELASFVGYTLGVKTVDSAKWNNFVAGLKKIAEVNVRIEDSSIKELNFTNNVDLMNVEDFIVTNNSNLRVIDLRLAVSSLSNFQIAGNPHLDYVGISSTSEYSGQEIIIDNNEALSIVSFQVDKLNLTSNLRVMRNKVLGRLSLSNLTKLNVAEAVISKNANLAALNFQSDQFVMPKLEIANNSRLRTINKTDCFESTQLTVRGNPRLDVDTLRNLLNLGPTGHSNEIQRKGECLLENKITDLCELKECQIVGNNLDLAENVLQSCNYSNLAEVVGDVNLANAQLEQLSFLENTQVNGTVYTTNCALPKRIFQISITFSTSCPPTGKATGKPTVGRAQNVTTTTKSAFFQYMTELSPGGVQLVTYVLHAVLIFLFFIILLCVCGCCFFYHMRNRRSDDPYYQ